MQVNNRIRHVGPLFWTQIHHCQAWTCFGFLRRQWKGRLKWSFISQALKVTTCQMNVSVSCGRPFKINVNQTNVLWLKRRRHRARARSLAARRDAHARFMILAAHYPPYLSKHTRALARVPRPTDGILRKVNLWRVLWGCADNPLWWICSHSQSVILKAFWMHGRPPPIWNRNFINHLH